ncbi:UDP-N-acetylglucosamine--N-acetylmuramyl-(pentapeptide) pyrophosphoryl-undecaprenol N-acetylglucosamine transferase [Bdellovibrio bacteriovorus]|uniref:UDP-N-acetylglucosamine--N-acetylmuramyl-(pentapeptide) pyrophosphoryl-undecaprenol N-acetylglucosamine transferase n=1 Tax=Bdellovibrio bacteriovorus TaxID=959 RepID=A0A150WSR9_BDEBC|nr:undecaprenyldiphospho-muramoylpentapeptide beta-N-acetylglucosaminyltransferase [Bdellovibrio bacteriovorus]KYG67446.1 UDP-N-acetylglucosamine--N-acetylmuramyl-(pentapeptide) pyrophosphoryl-undecaprenol N-acetylglucosamine transferase [Bdellovibrio bacteriovorus]
MKSSTSKKTIVIAGGGTGGHIYPGIAIARAIQKIDPQIEVHFVGTSRGLESKIVPREGFPLHLIESGQLNVKSPIQKIKTLLKIPKALWQSVQLLGRLKPLYVIGVGGYASGPFVLAASTIGFNTAIWEPNAMPGMANRLLSRFVDKCFVVFGDAKKHLKNDQVLQPGMPVRAEIESAVHEKHSDEKFHLLAFGGSQGSRVINNALSDAILKGGDWVKDLSVVHQVGSADIQTILAKYQAPPCEVKPQEFIYDMPKYYQWADIIVCRGGASSLAEAAAFGIIPIVIPLPAADDHQQRNAESLVAKNAARMILQKDLTPERLISEIQALRNDKQLREQMVQNIKAFYIPQAATAIAKEILQ